MTWIATLLLATAWAGPGDIEVLRRLGSWQWYALPLDERPPDGDAVLISACGDRLGRPVDASWLASHEVAEAEALAVLYTQANAATVLCLDPALLGLQRACPDHPPDPTQLTVEAKAVEQALEDWGSATVARAITALPGQRRCGGSFRAVVPAALRDGLGAPPAPPDEPLLLEEPP